LLLLHDHESSPGPHLHQMTRFYSVAVITSGSDPSSSLRACLDCPGDPGSIPGRTYEHAVHCNHLFLSILIILVCFLIFWPFFRPSFIFSMSTPWNIDR
jgi:hypothetical protein